MKPIWKSTPAFLKLQKNDIIITLKKVLRGLRTTYLLDHLYPYESPHQPK